MTRLRVSLVLMMMILGTGVQAQENNALPVFAYLYEGHSRRCM